MDNAAPATLMHADHPLWHVLSTYVPGPAGASLSFEQRLARENGWSLNRAGRVMEEYRRFCFLAMTAGHPVTPSDAVDQAWHLHLTYSRDYWERFCPQVLGKPFHHGPTAGGPDEHRKHVAQYALTLKSYEAAFGLPPADIWPSVQRRFFVDPWARRVHPRDAIVLPRKAACLGFAAAALAITVAALMAWGSLG